MKPAAIAEGEKRYSARRVSWSVVITRPHRAAIAQNIIWLRDEGIVMIIGISGKRNAGKDTLAQLICELDPSYDVRWFAHRVRLCVEAITGVPVGVQRTAEGKAIFLEAFGMTVGRMQQLVGDGLRQSISYDVWVKALLRDPHRRAGNIVIADVRHLNEVEAIERLGGVVVRIERDAAKPDDGRDDDHASETALDTYPYWDIIVRNNGTLDDLRESAQKVLRVVRRTR